MGAPAVHLDAVEDGDVGDGEEVRELRPVPCLTVPLVLDPVIEGLYGIRSHGMLRRSPGPHRIRQAPGGFPYMIPESRQSFPTFRGLPDGIEALRREEVILGGGSHRSPCPSSSVSYTHLTLPTILLV